jgi:hypothetical protein
LDDEHPVQGSLVLQKPAERAELVSPLGNAVAIWDVYSPSSNLLVQASARQAHRTLAKHWQLVKRL